MKNHTVSILNKVKLLLKDLRNVHENQFLMNIYTLTEHFIRNTFTHTYLCDYLISQSCGSSAKHKIVQIRVRSFS